MAAAAGQTELRRWAAEADAAATAAAAVVPTEGAAAKLGAWADWTAGKMARGCPAALLVAFECSQTPFEGDTSARRAQALGTELVANQLLAARADFQEGVACQWATRRAVPMWSHSSLEEAACDPEIVQILEAVRSAEPLDLTLKVSTRGPVLLLLQDHNKGDQVTAGSSVHVFGASIVLTIEYSIVCPVILHSCTKCKEAVPVQL